MSTSTSIEAGRLPGCLAALALAALLAGCGLTAPRGGAGYAAFESLGLTDVDNVLTLSLGPTVLRFAAQHLDDEPELQALLRALDGVRVRVYEIDGDAGRVAARAERMSRRLRERDWQPVAVVREGDSAQTTHMLIRATGERVHGITVISADASEAVIVNVLGDLRPALFTEAMAALNVPAPRVQLARAD